MGNSLLRDFKYCEFIGEKKPGETRIARHPLYANKELRTRSFLDVDTIWDGLVSNVAKGLGNKNFIGWRKKISKDKLEDKFTWLTYNEFIERAENFSRGLNVLNLCPAVETENKDERYKTLRFLGIYSKNKVEWLLAYLGAVRDSITITTLYDTLGEVAIEFILDQTKVSTVVIESKVLKKMKGIISSGKATYLKNLIVIDKNEELETCQEIESLNVKTYTFEDIENAGKEKGRTIKLTKAKPDDISTICFTSGTTGTPKGAMISHRSIIVETDVIEMLGLNLYSNDLYLSFLPFAHIMETLIITVVIIRGVQVGIYNGNAALLTEDAQILKPTATCVVPRVFQRLYDGINKELKKLKPLQLKIFNKAMSMKLKDLKETGNVKNVFWDNLVFTKIRNIMGGRLRFMLVGSAPMDDHILNFLRCALSCEIVEGYGQTESCAGVLLTRTYDPITQHIGGPGYSCEIKLKDIPEMEYTSEDKDENGNPTPRGEICLRGPLLFKGYLNNEEKTKEAIDEDGWLHSGDIGMILPHHGNAFKIIDRLKNMFKLQQGEYVAPEKLENILSNSKYVEQIFIYGEPTQNYLVAILVPKRQEIIDFMNQYFKNKGEETIVDTTNYQNYYDNEDLVKDILKSLEDYGRANDFKGFEIVKKIYLSKEMFKVENELLTPTAKIKRYNAKKRFINEINAMYGI